ncbi:MAG: hypothetical protein WAL63_11670 [Solirubrobacteraceae bacterium]
MGAIAFPGQIQGDLRIRRPDPPAPNGGPGEPGAATAQAAARRSLREQIARLERELAEAFVTAYSLGGLEPPTGPAGHPRLLDLAELEVVRDGLAARLGEARATIGRRADEQERKRVLLERMLLVPAEHRWARISCRELGEPGCGVWQVRPRLGLIGMLMGWWQVKLSSGCPLAGGRGAVPSRSAVTLGSRPVPAGA